MTTADPRPTGRLRLTDAQRAVADELFGRLTGEELAALATSLPFTPLPAQELWGHNLRRVEGANFASVIGDGRGLSAASAHRRYLVAAYCACAGQNGMAKLLTEMQRLKEQELALVNRIGGLALTMAERGLPLLLAAFKGEAAPPRDPDAGEYASDRRCPNCKKETLHVCRDDTHERDSSADYRRCTVCNWWQMGHGEYHAPLPAFGGTNGDEG